MRIGCFTIFRIHKFSIEYYYLYLPDAKNILFDEFNLVSFQMYYLLLLAQELSAIFGAFV